MNSKFYKFLIVMQNFYNKFFTKNWIKRKKVKKKKENKTFQLKLEIDFLLRCSNIACGVESNNILVQIYTIRYKRVYL